MKKLWSITGVITLAVAMSYCSEKPVELPKEAIVAGTITNIQDDKAYFRFPDHTDTVNVGADGTFHIKLDLDSAAYLRFFYNDEYASMYLQPGDSIHLTLDTEMFDETIKYSGKGAEANNCFAGLYLLDENVNSKMAYMDRYLMAPLEFRAYADSVKTLKSEFVNNFHATQALPQRFMDDQLATFLYDWAADLEDYSASVVHVQNPDSVVIPEQYYSYLQEAVLERPELLHNGAYRNFVNTRCGQMAYDNVMAKDSSAGQLAVNLEKLNVINNEIKHQAAKNVFLHESMMEIISYQGSTDISEIMSFYRHNCTDSSKVNMADKEYAEWQVIAPGKPAPNFSYEQFGTGEKVSLSSLKGKVVYVDVWATWCGPCRREIPDLQQMEHDYAGKDVVFVSVSVDESKEDWEKMVAEESLGGIQLLAENNWESDICKNYKINGIPRFILVGKDGNLISCDADRPSSFEVIRGKIDAALQENTVLN
jgi:thiol-disulfide isomerase/thioredoxin